nr:Gfo/Idh/MocA family oxidoreductase [Candidatus Sigynarchaeum springense]
MKRINVGIIGCGLMGNMHAMSVMNCIDEGVFAGKADIKLHAIADTDENTLAQRADLYEVPVRTADGHELCKDKDIDVIYVCTPTKYHAEFVVDAARHGKHVFVEKPLGTIPQIKDMIAARDAGKVTCQVGLVLRFDPLYWYVKRLVAEKAKDFGPMQNVIFRDDQDYPYLGSGRHPSKWRADKDLAYHGTLFEHSIHDMDQLVQICGDVESLAASVKCFNDKPDIEDSATVLLNFKSGASGSLTSVWYAADRDSRRGEFYFKNAVLEIVPGMLGIGSLHYKVLSEPDVKAGQDEIQAAFLGTVFKGMKVPPSHAYFYETVAFLRAIIDGTPPPTPLEDALDVHELIEACYEASRGKKVVTF